MGDKNTHTGRHSEQCVIAVERNVRRGYLVATRDVEECYDNELCNYE